VIVNDKTLDYNFDVNKRFFDSLKAVILSLVNAKFINLRKLAQNPEFNVPEFTFKNNNKTIYYYQSPILVLFYFLRTFYINFEVLHQNLIELVKINSKEDLKSEILDYDDSEEGLKDLISFCLHFILPADKAFEFYDTTIKPFESKKLGCIIHYSEEDRNPQVNTFHKNFEQAFINNSTYASNRQEKILNPYEVLLVAFKNCNNQGLLK